MFRVLPCLAMLASFWAQAAEPQPAPSPDQVLERATSCVRKAATRLERSDETPQSIAEAALVACTVERFTAANLFRQRPSPGFNLDNNLRTVAIAQVVFVRLCRRTQDCALAEAPK